MNKISFKIKRDTQGNSKGFGFVRFKEYNHQCAVLGKKHFIDGRWCDVKIPNSQVLSEITQSLVWLFYFKIVLLLFFKGTRDKSKDICWTFE